MRRTVEGDHGNKMIHVSDDRIEDGAEPLIVSDVGCPSSSGLDDDGKSEGLGAGVVVEGDGLRNAVVGDEEVVSGKFVDILAGLCLDLHGYLDKRGTHGEGSGWVPGLLSNGERGRKDQRQQSEDEALHSSLLYGRNLVVGQIESSIETSACLISTFTDEWIARLLPTSRLLRY